MILSSCSDRDSILVAVALQGLVVCLIYNFAGACAMVALKAPDRMSSWFLATIYCIAGIPLAMVLWYNKLYNTAAK